MARSVTIGGLFSGIGGLELGVERAVRGETIWQAERDPYARQVLERHWPGVRRYEDVCEIDKQAIRPDIICGGFPCQDISAAGKQAGITGEKSGLWAEFSRIVGVLRPCHVFVENVAALATNGLHRVLGDLAAFGYDAEWDTLGACCIGAPHQRERVFVLATDPNCDCESGCAIHAEAPPMPGAPAPIWPDLPGSVGVDDGAAGRMDRLRCLGNAVVPQQAELEYRKLLDRSRK